MSSFSDCLAMGCVRLDEIKANLNTQHTNETPNRIEMTTK